MTREEARATLRAAHTDLLRLAILGEITGLRWGVDEWAWYVERYAGQLGSEIMTTGKLRLDMLAVVALAEELMRVGEHIVVPEVAELADLLASDVAEVRMLAIRLAGTM